MKQNFTDQQVLKVFKTFANKFLVRINKSGNIDLVNPYRINEYEHFVLYLTPNNKYLWRRFTHLKYCYPLNMSGRTFVRKQDPDNWDYNLDYDGRKRYITKNSEFNTIDKAIYYFNNYLSKYYENKTCKHI